MDDRSHLAIAVVGVGAILPDAPDARSFWENLKSGRYSVRDVPTDRWDPALYYDPDHHAPDKTYSKIGAWVTDAPWEPTAWKLAIPPRVADAMDGGQRWALACARAALVDYGYPERPLDTERTAVILGNAMAGEKHYLTAARIAFPEYARWLGEAEAFRDLPAGLRATIVEQWRRRVGDALPPVTEDTMPGELSNCIAGRIANTFNLRGPNFTTDAACASAMAAITAAREGLCEGDFDAVITGGIDRNMGASSFVKFSKIGALSATGTRPFADGADGFVMGEGAALFVLKRLSDAEAAGDKIYAVLRGMAGSSDGKGKGITAPNPVGQRLAVARAWRDAGVAPAEGMMIEAHGTSTPVGDVVEVNSLTEVLGAGLRPGSMHLGSAKSNIGHLKSAAGAAGLLKAVFCLREKTLVPNLNARTPNPNVDWARSPFKVNTELRAWEAPASGVRTAAVSAFGFGGTNFHLVLEEHAPGRLSTRPRSRASGLAASAGKAASQAIAPKPPPRGAVLLGAHGEAELSARLDELLRDAEAGRTPPIAPPRRRDLDAPERVAIDFESAADLATRAARALKALSSGNDAAWKPLRAQGIFRGRGPAPRVAFLYTGQGSQYANMLRALREAEASVREVFDEADRIMTPTLGRPLSEIIYVDPADPAAMAEAEAALQRTEVTQPAVLAVDAALTRALATYGVAPDMVMGHSLGEYGALVAAGALSFEDALEAVSARGHEMSHVKGVVDAGKMAAVMGPLAEVQRLLLGVKGYVVTANINSNHQVVIGGSTEGVLEAAEKLNAAGLQVVPLPVSHAFHTSIVAPASEPLRRVLSRLRINAPKIPVVANTTGEPYPADATPAQIIELLGQQVAAPVQFIRGLETLYAAGARVFVEVGPKKALHGFAEDVLGDRADVLTLFTNHPKTGDVASLNQALCGLWSRGLGAAVDDASTAHHDEAHHEDAASASRHMQAHGIERARPAPTPATEHASVAAASAPQHAAAGAGVVTSYESLGRAVAELVQRMGGASSASPREAAVITGAGIGLPGTERVFDDENVARLLAGEQFIDVIPSRLRHAIADRHVTRLVKKEGQDPVFETIDDVASVIKLAGRAGRFDLASEYGVPDDRVAAYDRVTRLAIAAGLDALRDAGIPLVPRYRRTSKGTFLPEGHALPESMRDETGVIFACAFPGVESLIDEVSRFEQDHARRQRLAELESLRARLPAGDALVAELDRRVAEARDDVARGAYAFDRRFLFRVLSMGHSQFAELIRARGPNTQVNSACASTTQAVALAEDWIRTGRCRRAIVIAADDITSDGTLGWFGTGFLAAGAAATDEVVEDAATPFDRRRHGMIVGMGAAALVVEHPDAARERGVAPIVELLGTATLNSAFHGTRLDADHIASVMESMIARVEAAHSISRAVIAREAVFVSHETYTPARGGSAAAEVAALRRVFGADAERIVIANTKGFTGHAMGAGIEDVLAIKALETGVVPAVPNFKEADPDLGTLNLSRGGAYPVEYALRLAAGFGSQISMSLVRRVTRGPRPAARALGYAHRTDEAAFTRWLTQASGYATPSLEVAHRTLRVVDQGPPQRTTAAAAPPAEKRPAHAPAPEVAPAPVSAPVVAAPAPPPSAVVAPAVEDVAERVLSLVAEKTGYPRDMLQLDLDLEADLGIDTVKQAEVFATIREAYGIARDDKVKLRDYPTLAHVIRFVEERRPASRAAVHAAPTTARPDAPATSPAQGDDIADRVLSLVAEKTGYPRDMLQLDLDLEADLGIDTVKQAEVFATIREAYGIARDDKVKLRDYPTLAHVIRFVEERRAKPTAPAASARASEVEVEAAPAAATSALAPAEGGSEIERRVLSLVAEKTGYPSDMLQLDLDLEADLGIDTVKQAEVFATIREAYGIARDDKVKLRDYPTLAHVIRFVEERRAKQAAPASEPAATEPLATSAAATSAFPRRVPVSVLRPDAERFAPTGVDLNGRRVIVMADRGGVAGALAAALAQRGATAIVIEDAPSLGEAAARVAAWLGEGPIHGVFWLPALDAVGPLHALDVEAWRAAVHRRVKLAACVARVLYAAFEAPGSFFIAATRMGGHHGYDEAGALCPLGGAVTGFTKALHRERPAATIKCVDLAPDAASDDAAARLIEEALRDPDALEVGYARGLRWTVALEERPPRERDPRLDGARVFVITGAAGSITSAITVDLATASRGTFYLLDRVPAPDRTDPDLDRLATDREGLKRDLFARMKARGERATPAMVERELAALERAAAARAAIDAVERAGGRAIYRQADLRDGGALAAIVDEVRSAHGGVDVLVHAAGVEISRWLPDKSDEEFDLVFDTKADGLFHLLRAIGGARLGALVVFSSIAGRFGNGGQTDYAAANDLLCKVASSFRTARPETRGVAIDWTAWAGIGMASRGSIPKMMEAAGIEMLPAAEGVPVVRQELARASSVGEVVLAGALGVLGRAPSIDAGPELSAMLSAPGPMLSRVRSLEPTGALVTEASPDPKRNAFLDHHRIDGVPVLPGVMALEAFAESALLVPGYELVAFEDVNFLAAFKCFRDEPRVFQVSTVWKPEGSHLVAECALLGTRALPGQAPQTTVHHRARVRLARVGDVAASGGPASAPRGPGDRAVVRAADIYRVYFHGPAYQVLDLAWRDGDTACARLRADLPADIAPGSGELVASPRLVEACFQAAGLWELGTASRMGLPSHVGAVRFHPRPEGAPRYVEARASGDGFEARVVDERGGVYVELIGYRTVTVPSPVDASLLGPLHDAMR